MERPSIDKLMVQLGDSDEDTRGLKAGKIMTTDAEGGSTTFQINHAFTERNSGFFSGVAQPVGQKRMKSDLTALFQAIKEERQQRPPAFRPRLQIRSAETNAWGETSCNRTALGFADNVMFGTSA